MNHAPMLCAFVCQSVKADSGIVAANGGESVCVGASGGSFLAKMNSGARQACGEDGNGNRGEDAGGE
jgi:hypothetical protein